MTTEIELGLFMVFIYLFITFPFILELKDFSIYNPIRNYKEWTSFNWFGITIITIIINIVLLPYAIGYWIYKLFTVGRKEK